MAEEHGSLLQDEPDVFRLHGGAPPVVQVVLEVSVTNAKLQLFQKLGVVHQVKCVKDVEIGLLEDD